MGDCLSPSASEAGLDFKGSAHKSASLEWCVLGGIQNCDDLGKMFGEGVQDFHLLRGKRLCENYIFVFLVMIMLNVCFCSPLFS